MSMTDNVRQIYKDGESPFTGSSQKREQSGQYLNWLLTPEAEREPRYKKDLAESFGVSGQTLRDWSKDRQFQKELRSRQAQLYRAERVGDVLDALYERALDRSALGASSANSASKILLDYVQNHLDQNEESVDLSKISNDELTSKLIELLKNVTGARAS